MKKIRLKYKLKKFTVRFRKIWDFATLNSKRYRLTGDIDLSVKIIMRMMVKEGCEIRHSPMQGYFHLNRGHLYAKVSEESITLINGKYAYELAIPPQIGYELYSRVKAINERQLLKAERAHRERIEKSLQVIYDSLDKNTEYDKEH
jgi:hypothetical protein